MEPKTMDEQVLDEIKSTVKTLERWRAEKAELDAKHLCGVCGEVQRYPSGKMMTTSKCPLCMKKYCYKCEYMDFEFCKDCAGDE